jgi:uncharacterized membrane protein YgdD (TMEM256/DUF423 family)
MTRTGIARILAAFAGLMGAAGVALAAMAAHLPDAARLGSASSMLLFHACAVLGALALTGRRVLHDRIGLAASCAMVIGALLFAGDLVLSPAISSCGSLPDTACFRWPRRPAARS